MLYHITLPCLRFTKTRPENKLKKLIANNNYIIRNPFAFIFFHFVTKKKKFFSNIDLSYSNKIIEF